MSVAVGLLDFYILEASEYVDQLDALVGAAVNAPPESTPFITASRALRGSSTMAKLLRMAELAGSVERVGRALRDGSLRWTPELRSAVVAAIDDVRILLRTVRGWSATEEQRAAARIAELRRFVPDGAVPPNTPITGAISPTFFASEVEGIAAALDAFVAAPADRGSLDEALGRVRALRGISALKDLPPLADVANAIEDAARTTMVEGRGMTPQHAALYDASAHVLRRAARELRVSGRPDASAPEVRRFAEAASALQQQSRDEEQVVAVAALFYGDEGPHVVSRAAHPPTTIEARFRAEITSLAEHLRRLVADANSAATAVGRERAAHDLRGGLRTVRGDGRELRERRRGAVLCERRGRVEHPRSGAAVLDRRRGDDAGVPGYRAERSRLPARRTHSRSHRRSSHWDRIRIAGRAAPNTTSGGDRAVGRPSSRLGDAVGVSPRSPNAKPRCGHPPAASHAVDANRPGAPAVPAIRSRGIHRPRPGTARAACPAG